ncbi:MAG: tRNA 2-thiouridine(34) synthase MnmA [Oscillospiraceae bacterium]|jgi:tRNA-specific 2-thiouridylase|nr:tRNA 2-thiouridine(34) synthase MnmA [Oscillospiraceae bacterium]
MSGGVDSSVAAWLLRERGYDCIGATMKLFHGDNGSCCSLADVEDARAVAFKLKMPYFVFNFTQTFETEVLSRFVSQYACGATPNPCIDCNRYVKFDRFLHRARELQQDFIATGHYARIERSGGRYLLKKATDASKDQSYVLYAMTQEQLASTLFPLGELAKIQTREIAQREGFVNAKKRDSQDICFAPDGDYAAAIEALSGSCYPQGNFVDRDGRVLGVHKGLIRYTVGQRKGLGISAAQPLYVLEKRSADNTIVLGRREELLCSEFDAADFNWIRYEVPPPVLRVKACIRYRGSEQWATVTCKDTVHIAFDEPQAAVSKGQAVVLYDGEYVVGGGTIL